MRLRTFLTSAAAALIAAAALPVSPGQAATVAADPVVLNGVGAGHGVGMSQYGARVRATQGADAAAILNHYYPGATLSAAPDRPVRVLISRWDNQTSCTATPASGEPCLRVKAEPGQRFINTASGGSVAAPTQVNGQPVTELAVGAGSTGLTLWVKAGGWQVLEGGAQFTGPVDITAPDNTQTAVFGSTTRSYRGALRVARVSSTTVQRINVVSMGDYLQGVVPMEMPALWPDAALHSQGVAAATYAADAMRRYPTRSYDLCDTTSCQVYGGIEAEHANSTAKLAASPQRGKVLTSGGVPISAYFSSSNGGHSVSGGTSFLPARPDSADPNNTWTRTVDGACLAQKHPGKGSFTGVDVLARDGGGRDGGRVTRLRLKFTGGTVEIGPKATPMGTDSAMRGAFSGCAGSLPSSMFSVAGTAEATPPTTPAPTPEPAPEPEPAPAPAQPGVLRGADQLTNGQSLNSATGQHALAVTGNGWQLQSRSCPALPRGGTGTGRLVMQTDGNLVFYGSTVWHTGTHGNPGAWAVLQDDGNLVVYSATNRPLWSAGTVCTTLQAHDRAAAYTGPNPARLLSGDVLYSADRASRLVMQGDGNLVLYRGARALWNTGTHGRAGAWAVLQGDGNLVVYSAANQPLWFTGTSFPANASTLADSQVLTVLGDRLELRGVTLDTTRGTRSERLLWRS